MLTKQDFSTTRCLLDYCNANYTITIEKSYGYLNETTGQYDGIVGDLQNGIGDLAGNTMFMVKGRLEVVDYVKMLNQGSFRFIFKQPPLSYTSNIMADSFRTSVWISMLIVLLLFAVALYVILNWESKRKKVRMLTNSYLPNSNYSSGFSI